MSHRNVEQVIGRLVTDEAFRRRFGEDAAAAVQTLIDEGVELNPCERRALLAIDPVLLRRFADAVDPCIQKAEISGGRT